MARPTASSVQAPISSLLNIHPRFMRSVHLERDIEDPASSMGYILTETSKKALERVTASFSPNSTQRAWRLAGDYGSGKTDLALVLARVASGETQELPSELKKFAKKGRLQPKLATGSSEPLGATVLRALGIESGVENPAIPEVLSAVRKSIKSARSKSDDGIILIVDEFGKNLEYAARHSDADDIFLLQRLAEEASRSGDNTFVIVIIVHQGIMSYAAGLDSVVRAEWSKVSGRYEEVAFVHPIEQTAVLLHATLGTDADNLPSPLRGESIKSMKEAVELGFYGTSGGAGPLSSLAPGLFPLHPTTVPTLLAVVRRFGQNERSLFSFISSAEPLGLQHHSRLPIGQARHYRISHLYDYVAQNLASSIHGSSAHTRWGIIEAIVSTTLVESPLEEAVLKTVGLLNLVDSPEFAATKKLIRLACKDYDGPQPRKIDAAIANLEQRGVLYERGISAGLCLWPHTSVDIEQAFERGFATTSQTSGRVESLCSAVSVEPLVPRGYYVETGTLRYATVAAAPAVNVLEKVKAIPALDGKGGDLAICIYVPVDERQFQESRDILAKNLDQIPEGVLAAVVEPPAQAISALQDLSAWKWVEEHTPALSGDRFAREEVSRQVAAAEYRFRGKLDSIFGLATNGGGKVQFYFQGATDTVKTGRDLLTFLGAQCRAIYKNSPKVKNELINRRAPSAAANSARTKLAEAMASSPHQPLLGMNETLRPPEMALYLSVLQKGNFHSQTNEGAWEFQIPSKAKDVLNLLPSLVKITETLRAGEIDSRVPIPQIFDVLRCPPFGVRDGLLPFILAIYLATHHQRVALYEDGSYLHQVGGDHFMRLMKEPQAFSLQYCGLDGVRATVLPQLLDLLKFPPRDPREYDLLDLVRPLAVFIAQEIPDYARRTNTLSATAIAVRKALLEAREPVKMVFTQLPNSCGLPPISGESKWDSNQAKEFAERLGSALHELRNAYGALLERVGLSICKAFDGSGILSKDRSNIAGRAGQLSKQVTEPSLKAFAVRLADTALTDRAWIESIANLLAKKSAERWADIDEAEFYHQIELLSGRFRRVEAALFHGAKIKLNGHACRIALTKTDGSEVNDLVRWDDISETTLSNVEQELTDLIARNGREGLAAAMKVLWNRLSEPEESKR